MVVPLEAFYDMPWIRMTYSRLKPPASSRGYNDLKEVSILIIEIIMARLGLEPRHLAPDAKSLTTAQKLPQERFDGRNSGQINVTEARS